MPGNILPEREVVYTTATPKSKEKKRPGEGPPAGGERRERLPRHFLRALPDLEEEPEDFEDEELDRPEELERPEEEEPPDLTEPDERLEEPPPDRGAL